MKRFAMAVVGSMVLFLISGPASGQWTQVTGAMTSDRIISLAVKSNGYIFAGTYSNGLYRSTDGGSNWTQVMSSSTPPSGVYEVFSIAFDSSGNVYAGTYAAGLYRSTDNGGTWTLLSSSSGSNILPIDDIYSITIPSSGTILVSDGSSSNGSVYRSTDNGSTWTDVLNGAYIYSLSTNSTFSPSTEYVYAGGTSSYGLFHYSTDDGATWTSATGVSNLTAVAARSASEVFVGTGSKGIYRSTDNGTHWSIDTVGLGNDYINYGGLAIDHAGVVYTGTQGGGVYYSSNDGASWTADNSGLSNSNVNVIAFDHSGNVFAGTDGSGLWHTGDIPLAVDMESFQAASVAEGISLTWKTASETDNAGFNVLRKASGETDYSMIASYAAVTSLRGLGTRSTGKTYGFTDNRVKNGQSYDYLIEEVSVSGTRKEYGPVRVIASLLPKSYSLSQNYPNPFNPTTMISYQISAVSNVTLKVYNALGREVARLVNGVKQPGSYAVQFNGSRLASGIYFYRLTAGNFSETKRLMLIK